MSKIDSIEKPNAHSGDFAESFERLQAVESVAALMAHMAGLSEPASLVLNDQAAMESYYHNSLPMTQKRFDRGCDELAVMAQSGAKALFQLNSAGRKGIDTATRRLMQEIQISGQRTLGLLRK
ncbi:MAG: hypothetical protein V7676_01100 [Parasphingorhabdus sp.]|uniref:hypothetical protein n=1 Tax=Parasphingorhabdus sp. TaxID=2709688 RepID=UPI0030015F9D